MNPESPIDPIQADLLKQTWYEKWHLAISWLYLIINFFDFLIAPILNNIILAYYHYPIVQWQSITLQGGGIFHISMMAIIGISTFGRSQQMVEAIRNMPDYSGYGGGMYGSGMGYGMGGSMMNQPLVSNPPPDNLNPGVDPTSVLQAPRRGIPKGN